MVRKIVVSETDLDEIEPEPEDFLPPYKYEFVEEEAERMIRKQRKKSKDRKAWSRRFVL